jgi:hypothetical protein
MVWPVDADLHGCAAQTRRGPARARGKTRRRSPARRKQRRRTSQLIRRNGKQRPPQRRALTAVTQIAPMEKAAVATGPRRAPRRRRGRRSLRSARGCAICLGCRATTHAIRYCLCLSCAGVRLCTRTKLLTPCLSRT